MPIPGKPIHAITTEARHLRDLIFDEVRGRGIALRELSFRIDESDPCVRFGVEGVNLAGARIRIRDGEDLRPKVITVSGASDGWSRSWQRRLDYTFDIAAVAEFLVALIGHERGKPPMSDLRVPTGAAASTSGLHVMQLAAIRLGVCPPSTTPEDLLGAVSDKRRRARIARGLAAGGLIEADLRALADAMSLHLYRPNKVDFDPFDPFGRDTLPIALVGRAALSGIERRYVLVLDYGEHAVKVADPAGEGLVTSTRDSFRASWKLAERRDLSWVGLVTPTSTAR
ncbi:MAG: hypothetical protein WDO74_04455 [Pseudomonadota bacterium]